MAIKKLQNNFTTVEQSKRLLELGLPADSADCYYDSWKQIQWRQLTDLHNDFFDVYKHYTPCWSVGRLIEISELCYTSLVEQEYYIKQKDCNMDYLVKILELAGDSMDFSKLEE